MLLAEDPFSHTYVGSSEFNVAAFSTTFDRKSFGRRIVAKINMNLKEPTISADQSWAYLNFGTPHKHCFLYDTGASVILITTQTFEQASQNGKVGKKWSGHGISIKNASKGAMEITGMYTIHFLIDRRDMEARFIVTPEASSNIIGMNVIRTYKLKMDVLTTTVPALLAHVPSIFFLEAFYNISHGLGGITHFGVFSDAFPSLKMWVTFAWATANFLTHFIISITVLENMPPDAGLQKRATFPH
jgi:hypothetical protein